ncbi:hypothetical protein [Microvirga tunisiensis]|uniref:Uncharacterized protein n=1 Tax=Microvirga tunisiensis TaxID=2108360 RepID=A0A5N7MB70_9HYPH|nr:hypothetical protein [Microvirga tunisiensis]MPR06309.1 hypothetical protein [Microvirga tunisiensis]MPR24095.1 hypothetical protein [Microvirga tunisiensis]
MKPTASQTPMETPSMVRSIMTREDALAIKNRWHDTCRRYNEGNASGADMSLAFADAARAVQQAERDGADMTDVRKEHPALFSA